MAMRKILVDETNRELCEHGTVGFPMTVNHDDLWAFEGKSVPIHWHNDLEISLPYEKEKHPLCGTKSYTVRPADVLFFWTEMCPSSCHSPNNSHARYSTFWHVLISYTANTEVMLNADVFCPFLQNSSVPLHPSYFQKLSTRTVIRSSMKQKHFGSEDLLLWLKIKGLLCEIFGMTFFANTRMIFRICSSQPAGTGKAGTDAELS